MMQVSTLYAHTLERQLVSRRATLLSNLSKTKTSSPIGIDQTHMASSSSKAHQHGKVLESPIDEDVLTEELWQSDVPGDRGDELQKLGAHSPPRNGSSFGSEQKSHLQRLSQSTGNLANSVCKHLGLFKPHSPLSSVTLEDKNNNNSSGNHTKSTKPATPSGKTKKKGGKVHPPNFMVLGTWCTRECCDKFLSMVASGDILEFNIKMHHHWGIAIVQKNRKPSLTTVEVAHLLRDKEGRPRVVKQTLNEYWQGGVTARINNSRDVNKPPLPPNEVAATALKYIVQPYRMWRNSEEVVVSCRYGDGQRARQLSDAARWGALSRCAGLWLTLKTGSASMSTSGSPVVSPRLRQRTISVDF
ncbi:lethal (1) G0469 NlpC/P60 domain-containing protein [Oratosquilla oratoria]|uniref:lethal (1) G0469 NlpC/P60 domain-containing protein n=1 Tax=Oratosquilla oratoria TaxID=337810 RepID=UPI003F769E6E